MISTEQIREIAVRHLEGTPLFLLGAEVKKGNRITVTLDGDRGVTIDDCIRLSRHIESQLDRDREDYDLQVTSGGADTPLTLERQFPKHVGRTLQVTLSDGSSFTGVLKSAGPEGLVFETVPEKTKPGKTSPPAESKTLAFSDIKQAVILISFV